MSLLFLTASRRAALLTLFLITALGCDKNDNTVAVPKTITDQILEDSQFSLLRVAMAYANVGDAFKGANLTLFAPNDAAFQASNLGSEAAIKAMSPERVKNVLMGHLLYAPVLTSTVPYGSNAVGTAGKGVAFLNRATDGTVLINNARVVQADQMVANGIIHTIDQVLMPSGGTLEAVIQTNPDLTLLSAAIKRIGSTNPTLTAVLSGAASANTSTVTLFAPNDAAFRADGRFKDVTAIGSANVQVLTNMLLYHAVSGVLFANQLQTGNVTTLLSGNRLNLTVTPAQINVKGNKNTTSAIIRTPDLIGTNGVIHVIDQILLP